MMAVPIRNCDRCGRVFSGVDTICPACHATERDEFDRVKAYVEANPSSMVVEVGLQTGVDLAQIYRWVRAGRLKMTVQQLGGAIVCERCGNPISTGRFCANCLAELTDAIRKASRESSAGSGPALADQTPSPPPERKPPASRDRPRVYTAEDVRRRFV